MKCTAEIQDCRPSGQGLEWTALVPAAPEHVVTVTSLTGVCSTLEMLLVPQAQSGKTKSMFCRKARLFALLLMMSAEELWFCPAEAVSLVFWKAKQDAPGEK